MAVVEVWSTNGAKVHQNAVSAEVTVLFEQQFEVFVHG
jgi:hypothetical protein